MNKSYVQIHNHTSLGSLLDGFSRPKDLVRRAKELGMKAIGVSDHGTCFAHVSMYEECLKNNIKPILATETYIAFEKVFLKANRFQTHQVIWSRNSEGIKDLWKMVSYSNEPDIFYYKPRLNIWNSINPENNKIYYGVEEFAKNGNLQSFSGHMGSLLSDSLFVDDLFGDPKIRQEQIKKGYSQYKQTDQSFYNNLRSERWLENTCNLAIKLEKVFGKGNFWIELQNELDPNDKMPMWLHPTIVDSLREVSKQTGIPAVCSGDPHYVRKEDARHQRSMLQITLKETDQSIEEKLSKSDEMDILPFFGSDSFYLKSYDEIKDKFTSEEIEESNKIADQIEEYNLLKPPSIPRFSIPKFNSESKELVNCSSISDKFLLHLVINGAKEIKPWEYSGIPKKHYWERVKEECEVIFDAKISDYLLLIWDILSFCRNCPADGSYDWMKNIENKGKINPIGIGKGRGSVGGSLVCYFMKLHEADSLKYGLIFSRFFNPARANDMPDVDIDLEMNRREEVVKYLQWKYGEDKVCQIMTFGKSMAKNSIRDLFRIRNIENGLQIANEICKYIPDEAKIADEIQEVRNYGEEYGTIDWSLDNIIDLQPYYDKYKDIFDEARKIEGTYRNVGRHASGYLVSSGLPIQEELPMAWDSKSKKKIAAFSMDVVAKLSFVKIDLLGLTLIDKIGFCQKLINKRKYGIV